MRRIVMAVPFETWSSLRASGEVPLRANTIGSQSKLPARSRRLW